MPSVEEHCRISLERTRGYCDYRGLHEWMDRPERYLGVNHRLERHVDNDIYREFIRKRWGEKAVIEVFALKPNKWWGNSWLGTDRKYMDPISIPS